MQKNFTPENEKHGRQEALRKLLEDRSFKNQTEVVKAMKKLGFSVTQPSISRDFRDLGVIRVNGRYQPQAQRFVGTPPSMFSQFAGDVLTAGDNLIVLRTAAGAANAVAEELDNMEIPGLVGTVAGDNTIFLATAGKSGNQRVMKTLRTLASTEH